LEAANAALRVRLAALTAELEAARRKAVAGLPADLSESLARADRVMQPAMRTASTALRLTSKLKGGAPRKSGVKAESTADSGAEAEAGGGPIGPPPTPETNFKLVASISSISSITPETNFKLLGVQLAAVATSLKKLETALPPENQLGSARIDEIDENQLGSEMAGRLPATIDVVLRRAVCEAKGAARLRELTAQTRERCAASEQLVRYANAARAQHAELASSAAEEVTERAVAEAEAALGAALATVAPLAEALGTLKTWTDDLPCMNVLTTAPHSP
jgi:hypothetical protein